jgi:hypothetical protein
VSYLDNVPCLVFVVGYVQAGLSKVLCARKERRMSMTILYVTIDGNKSLYLVFVGVVSLSILDCF